MIGIRVRRATGAALGAVVLVLAAGPLAVPGAAAQSSGQPAFTTSEAPGGAATAGQRVIALTFDDGPGPFTPQVLSVLEQYRVPATFFEIGDEVARYAQYSKMVVAAGFPVEDHTWSHPDLTTLPASGVASQIDTTQAEIQAVTGTAPQCVRPPYDAWNATVLSQIAARGLTTMSYSVDPKDWTLPGVQSIVSNVVGAAFPGAVVDMHDAGGDRSETVAALPQIITRLRAMGYTFISICGAGPHYGPQVSATYAFGNAPAPGPPVTSNLPLVGAATTADGGGYWEVATDGGIFSFGDATFHGSMGGTRSTRRSWAWRRRPTVAVTGRWPPTVGSSPSVTLLSTGPWAACAQRADRGHGGDGRRWGYWEVAADGGIFSFGDAASTGPWAACPSTRRSWAWRQRRRRLLGGGGRRRRVRFRCTLLRLPLGDHGRGPLLRSGAGPRGGGLPPDWPAPGAVTTCWLATSRRIGSRCSRGGPDEEQGLGSSHAASKWARGCSRWRHFRTEPFHSRPFIWLVSTTRIGVYPACKVAGVRAGVVQRQNISFPS